MVDAVEMLTSEAAGGAPTSLPRRFIVAATVGNALEFYDFVTYTFFAIQIGHAFFPSTSAYGSLMLSLATFGAGFVTRPIGALVIGAYADRVGRRSAMMLSLTMMGAAIVVLALTPSYAQIGVAAPILAVLARMAQGFSLGGEVGPTTAYLLEAAPAGRRGLAVAWQGASQGVASSLGALAGFSLSTLLSPAALDAYGWRIAFLLGAVALPFGLWIRRGLPETLHLPDPSTDAPSPVNALALIRAHGRIIVLALGVLTAGTIATYVLNYMTTFAQSTLHMKPGLSLLASALAGVAGVGSAVYGGWLCDRIGRRPLLIWPNLASLLIVLPVFHWIISARSALALLAGTTCLAAVRGLATGAFYATVAEALPKRIRSGVLATVYAAAIAIFGGTTQLVVTWLIRVTGDPMSPAWYMFAALLVGQVAYMFMSVRPRSVVPMPAEALL
jgi:MFS family permease